MTSEDLAEHANKVMTTLDDGIRGLDDMDAFFEYLYQVGGSHTRIAGFKAEYFWVSNFSLKFLVTKFYLHYINIESKMLWII